MRTILTAAAFVVATFFIVPVVMTTPALAAETVDFQPVVQQFAQIGVDIVVSVLGLVGLWLAMLLKQKLGVDIEAQVRSIEAMHRDTLHSAVSTWTNAAINKFGANLKLTADNPALAFILNGVKSSAPEAITALEASDTWIVNKAAGILGVTDPVIQPD